MKTLGFLFFAILVLSGCSASTSPVASQIDNSIQLRSIDRPGDTIWIRSSEFSSTMTIQATVADILTEGVAIVYLDPLTHVNRRVETYSDGKALIILPTFEFLPHRDTSFIVDFRGLYGAGTGPAMRKVIVCMFGTEPPTLLWFNASNEATIAVRWDRTPHDRYVDTLIVKDTSGVIQTNIIPAASSEFTLSGLRLGKPYTFILHTRGGSTSPADWGTVLRSGVIRLHAMETANGSEIIGISFTGAGFRTVTPSEFDSADLILGDMPQQIGSRTALLAFLAIKTGFKNYVGRGQDANFSNWQPQSIQDTYFPSEAIGGLHVYPFEPAMYVDTTSRTPVMALGYQILSSQLHYMMIQVDPQPGGKLTGRDAEGKFIDIEVVYQPVANLVAL